MVLVFLVAAAIGLYLGLIANRNAGSLNVIQWEVGISVGIFSAPFGLALGLGFILTAHETIIVALLTALITGITACVTFWIMRKVW